MVSYKNVDNKVLLELKGKNNYILDLIQVKE